MKQQLPALGVRLNRIPSLLITVVVLATLCAPAIIQMAGQSTDPTFIDNRRPPPVPTLPRSIADFEKFRNGMIDFVERTFGLRAEMVQINILIHWWLGVSAIPDQIVGKKGWFFLKSEHAALDQYRGLNRFSEQDLDAWIDTVDVYRRWLKARGIQFMIVVAPSQQTIYPEYLPTYVNRVWPETRLDQISRRLRERKSEVLFVDLRPALWSNRKLGFLYNKYENHWNALGGFVGYSAVVSIIEVLFPGAIRMQMSEFSIVGERHRWTIPPLSETQPALVWKGPSRVVGADSIARLDGYEVSKVRTNIVGGPDVLVYGDSFAEVGLLPYFQQSFRSTTYVPTNQVPFPRELIEKHPPDLVIFELVERYLVRNLSPAAELESDLLFHEAPSYRDVEPAIGVIGGYIDGATDNNGVLQFSGWAIDPQANLPASAIYLYDGYQVVAASKMSVPRPDVSPGMADHKAGFLLSVARDIDLRQLGHRLRFFTTNPSQSVREVVISPPVFEQIEAIFKKRAGN